MFLLPRSFSYGMTRVYIFYLNKVQGRGNDMKNRFFGLGRILFFLPILLETLDLSLFVPTDFKKKFSASGINSLEKIFFYKFLS